MKMAVQGGVDYLKTIETSSSKHQLMLASSNQLLWLGRGRHIFSSVANTWLDL